MDHPLFDMDHYPPIARTLGWRLVAIDEDTGTIEIGFEGKPEFCNPAGNIQGGILTAMLDDSMGPAALVASNGKAFTSSVDIHTHFLKPVQPGPITTRARVTRMGSRMAFLEAQLFDADGNLCARATSSAMLQPLPTS